MCPHHGGSTDTGSRRPSLRHRLPTWTPGGPHFIRKHESGWGHVQGRAHAELWSGGGGRVQGLRQSWMRGSLLTIPGRDVETPRPAPGLKGQTLTLPKGPKGTFCLQEPYVGGGGKEAGSAETTPRRRRIPPVCRHPPGLHSKPASFRGRGTLPMSPHHLTWPHSRYRMEPLCRRGGRAAYGSQAPTASRLPRYPRGALRPSCPRGPDPPSVASALSLGSGAAGRGGPRDIGTEP